MSRSLRDRWDAGEAVTGAWVGLADDVTTQLMASAGFGVLCLDLQHGFVSFDSLPGQLRVATRGAAPVLVRVASHDPTVVMRALDLGADGVIMPMVETAEQARGLVAACRYAPAGARSWGPIWAEVDGVDVDPPTADRSVLAIAMVETAAGLAAIEDIAAVPGLDAVYVGPNDLALSLGLGRTDYGRSPQLGEAIEQIIEACRARGVVVGVDGPQPGAARYWAGLGAQLILATKDTIILRDSAGQVAGELARSADQVGH